MFNINLLNPLNLIRPMSFINVMDLINSIEPINLMNQNNIMNLNLQNFVRNPLAQNIMNPLAMDQNNFRNIMNLIDLKEIKDLMNQNNQMNLIDLNKLKNQIYLIEQILSLHLMSVKNLNIPFDEMKDLKIDLKEDLKNLTNQIYSIEPMNPKYSINSFFPNNQMYFLDRKKILPQINLNFNETINKIKNNTKNENSPIDDKELSSKNKLNKIMMDKDKLDQLSVDLKDAFEYYKYKVYFGVNNQNNLDRCQNCFSGANYIIKNSFFTLPKYLIINLNKRNKNLNVKFTFPEIIDLKEEVQYNLDSQVYRLICAITRVENSNHYISFSYLEEQKKWFKFDDDQVKKTTFNEVSSLGSICNLIYEKIDL